jgi:hypothetical protein
MSLSPGLVGSPSIEENKAVDVFDSLESLILKCPLPTALPGYRPAKLTTIDDWSVGECVIGPTDILEQVVGCPCCRQPPNQFHTTPVPVEHVRNRGSLIQKFSCEDDEEEEEPEVENGVNYYQKRVLAEGWVHKKGSGQDWLGSTSWKSRWARLVTARVDGYDCDVPLLLMYWHPSSPVVCTGIMLESAVSVPIDLDDKEKWNAFRFEIRHAASRQNVTLPVTRTFSAPKNGRDAWVFAICEALLAYEKEKDLARKASSWKAPDGTAGIRAHPVQEDSRPKSPVFHEPWTGDIHRPTSPHNTTTLPRPTSPIPPRSPDDRLRFPPLSPNRVRTPASPPLAPKRADIHSSVLSSLSNTARSID